MKKYWIVLLIGGLCLLAACASLTPAARSPSAPPASAPEEAVKPVYQFDTLSAQERFAAGDGTELARYSYQLLTMSVENMDELALRRRRRQRGTWRGSTAGWRA